MADTTSFYYPYEHVESYATYTGLETIPRQIITYLMDMPNEEYTPPDNNQSARCRLIKYLYYDVENPLSMTLPTPAQKLSILYDAAEAATPTTEKGYRLFPQSYISQAQEAQKTTLSCYVGRVVPRTTEMGEIGIYFEILSSTQYESNLKSTALSRTTAMEQCIIEALNGVNMNGIGTFYYDRRQHADCGAYSINDEKANVGRRLCMALSWAGGEVATIW